MRRCLCIQRTSSHQAQLVRCNPSLCQSRGPKVIWKDVINTPLCSASLYCLYQFGMSELCTAQTELTVKRGENTLYVFAHQVRVIQVNPTSRKSASCQEPQPLTLRAPHEMLTNRCADRHPADWADYDRGSERHSSPFQQISNEHSPTHTQKTCCGQMWLPAVSVAAVGLSLCIKPARRVVLRKLRVCIRDQVHFRAC